MSVILGRLSGAFLLNCELFALTLLFALPLGLVVAFGSMSRFKPLSGLVKVFVWIIRGTPILVQLFVVFYGLPGVGILIEPFPAAVLVFSINEGAYGAETIRAALESVPKGQLEAGQCVGMSYMQIMWRIILPQALRTAFPTLANSLIAMVKDTSLANTIANKEIIMMAKEYSAKGLIWPLFSTALFFLVFVGALTLLFNWAEKKLDYFR